MVSVVSLGSSSLSSRMSESLKPCINKPVRIYYTWGVGWGEWIACLVLLSEIYCMIFETIPNTSFVPFPTFLSSFVTNC